MAVDYCDGYLYGNVFTIIKNHPALLAIVEEDRSNKSYNSRLSSWFDRVLPYNLSNEHMPGAKVGLIDYFLQQQLQMQRKFPHMTSVL